MTAAELYSKTEYCCGCSACKEACPEGAIEMREGTDGFVFPFIDETECIDCGICLKTCNFKSSKPEGEPAAVYGGKTKTTDIKKSSSGGIFAAIAECLINDGAAVYGSAMIKGETPTAKHVRCETEKELEALYGSKYVQSDINGAYSKVKADLESGKTVLFSGTPCQVDGLYGFLKKDYEHLYTADIICHGVPSAKMFADYIKTLEGKSRVEDFEFRCKKYGGEMTSRITFENKKESLIPCGASAYFYLFINGHTYRDSCYSCKYADKSRVGDITLGDFWGVEKYYPEFPASDGCSCILVNTEKGGRLFDKASENFDFFETDFEKVSENNAQLKHPSRLTKARSEIFKAYENEGFGGVEKVYGRLAGKAKYISKAKLIAKKILK